MDDKTFDALRLLAWYNDELADITHPVQVGSEFIEMAPGRKWDIDLVSQNQTLVLITID